MVAFQFDKDNIYAGDITFFLNDIQNYQEGFDDALIKQIDEFKNQIKMQKDSTINLSEKDIFKKLSKKLNDK